MYRTACTEPQCQYSTAIHLLPLCTVRPVKNLSACTLQLYIYSPYVPYGLYRASVPVQYSYTSTPPMYRRPVQSLSACTVQLNLYFPYGPYSLYRASVPVQYSYTSTPPVDRTACTEPQCLYSTAIPLLPPMDRTAFTEPQCLYSRAIPLLPLWFVRPLQSLSACTVQLYLCSPYGPYSLYRTSVPVQYSYTSTPPMVRTACTEPQCLYSIALPLLPLWTVQPVQNLSALYSTAIPLLPSVPVQYSYTSTPLSACTVQLYLYSPYGPYSLYRASVPVQGCTLTFYEKRPENDWKTSLFLLDYDRSFSRSVGNEM